MSHQDWTPVVIHGKAAPMQRPSTKHYERTKEQKLEDEEIGTHKKVPLSMAKMIQQGRIAKGFRTQKDLAIAVGVNAGIISSYESGRAIPDPSHPSEVEKGSGCEVKVGSSSARRCNRHLRNRVLPMSLPQIWPVVQYCSRRVNPS